MSEYYYTVYIDTADFGHVFIGISGPDGEEVWGYYPKVDNPWLYAPESSAHHVILNEGEVRNDATHPYTATAGPFELTEAEYYNIKGFIELVQSNPGNYFAGGNNCVEFVEKIMDLADDRPFFNAVTPKEFLNYLALDDYIKRILMGVWDKIRSIFNAGENAVLLGSPIILDLDKDGVETTSLTSGTYFDHDANGFSEQTGWASSDDGLLVMDRDADGLIEDGTELFGDNTLLANGTKATNGFQALAELDSNTDGKIDANDAAYNQLRIWQDIDEDGYTSEGELDSFRLLFSV